MVALEDRVEAMKAGVFDRPLGEDPRLVELEAAILKMRSLGLVHVSTTVVTIVPTLCVYGLYTTLSQPTLPFFRALQGRRKHHHSFNRSVLMRINECSGMDEQLVYTR